MSTRTPADWQKLAVQLANASNRLAAAAVDVGGPAWRIAPLARGILRERAQEVSRVLELVRRADRGNA